jgi:tetratricopeptide (TPR) repeat protein
LFQAAISGAEGADDPSLRAPLATALRGRATTLESMTRNDEALVAFDELIRMFGADDAADVRDDVVRAHIQRAILLGELGQSDEALAQLDNVIGAQGASMQDQAYLDHVDWALSSKVELLKRLGRPLTAVATTIDLVERRVQASDEVPDINLWYALHEAQDVQCESPEQLEAVAQIWKDCIARCAGTSTVGLRWLTANALIALAHANESLKRIDAMANAYDEAFRRECDAGEPAMRALAVKALQLKAYRLRHYNRHAESLAANGEIMRRFGHHSSGELAVAVAQAMSHQAVVYAELAQPELALSVRTALIERLKPADEPELREIATDALLAIGSELHARGSDAEAIAAWSRLIADYGSTSQESGVRGADQTMSDKLLEESVEQNVIHALERLASMFLSEGRASGSGAERSRLCAEAKSRLERLVEIGADRRRLRLLAFTCHLAGDPQAACGFLEQALAMAASDDTRRGDDELDAMSRDPTFEAFVRDLGFGKVLG